QFMTVRLVEKDGHMTGSVSVGDINVDLNGDVIRAAAPESESPIVSSRLLPVGGLELTSRGEDPDDTITVALKLIDATTGSVRFKAVPGDTLAIKPIAVHKNRAQPVLWITKSVDSPTTRETNRPRKVVGVMAIFQQLVVPLPSVACSSKFERDAPAATSTRFSVR